MNMLVFIKKEVFVQNHKIERGVAQMQLWDLPPPLPITTQMVS
jgi:hypothetical protein